uniref:zona pellucida sperm-binding protein 4-like n=1 Tax=Monopterus albus TaxID=43700 RepID=UPI0009B49EF9|nr:zona pellucida sperm-binding protein 4-like [Monopterus albus]
MIHRRAKLRLIYFIFAFSTLQGKLTPEQRTQLVLPTVTCSTRGITAVFGPQVKSNVRVRDMSGATVPVPQLEGPCGVRMGIDKDQSLSFFSRYDSCYARTEGRKVVIPLQVQLTGDRRLFGVNISCPLIKRSSESSRLTPTPLPGNCDTERALRVACGHQSVSREACYKLGCCYDAHDSTCYYKLNACSLDGHFVFSVKATDTEPPIDPSSLSVKDQPQCSPVLITQDTAVFKIGIMDCGAKMKVDRDVMIYELEVQELHAKRATKQSPFSLQVQCEYDAADLERAADLRSLHAATNPPPVVALGTINVQMRIATDASFTSFFPNDQLPLTLPLREPVYVEVSIAQPSPDSTLALRVQDCFAYPASRYSVWTLIYEGCGNPLDNMKSSVPVDHEGKTTSHSQIRRFDVKTFAFLDPQTGHPSVEEMYFYCWVEICTDDDDDDCAQQCTLILSESERQRREATSESDQVQLVSLGPLVLGQNGTEPEDNTCETQNRMFQVTLYILCSIGAVVLLVLLFTVWSRIRKCQKAQVQQAGEAQAGEAQAGEAQADCQQPQ